MAESVLDVGAQGQSGWDEIQSASDQPKSRFRNYLGYLRFDKELVAYRRPEHPLIFSHYWPENYVANGVYDLQHS